MNKGDAIAMRDSSGASRRELLGGAAAILMLPGEVLAQTVRAPDKDAPDAPAVRITNGLASAVLYLPDPQKGYYRATRFDWSGAIAEMHAAGHNYFGRWFASYNPHNHDAISGPVQEYVDGQGFADAPPGGTFIKVGVGVLRKPAEPIKGFPTLEIVDGGKWSTRVRKDAVDFMHEVSDPVSGYGYRYTKTVALTPGKPQLTLTQHIESTGTHPIDTEMYDHNFFVLDGQDSGPDVEVRFPFALEPSNVTGEAMKVSGNQLNYSGPITRSAYMKLRGFGRSKSDYDVRVENKKTGAGVRITADQPLSDFVFWTNPKTTCPECYIHVYADRGRPMDWKITYDFYSLRT